MLVERGTKRRFVGAPAIGPLPNDARRPLISVMIPVYNNTEYLRETLESVLMQDLGPREMEIEVLDNCSSRGQSEEIVAEVGKGRISFYRHETNIGAIGNFNSCINRARGEWIHVLHADDTVAPGFYARARQAIMLHPCISAVTCRIEYIDDVGRSIGLAEPEAAIPCVLPKEFMWRQLTSQRFQFVGMIVRRAAYEELGAFRPELAHCADWDMWNRLVVAKQIFYEPDPLARYRLHSGSDSSQAFVTAENVRDERRSIRISCAYVSEREAYKLLRQAMRLAGGRAARRARMYLVRGNWRGALCQANEALHCSLSPAVLARIAYHVALAILSHIKATFRRVLRRERDGSSTAQQ